LDQEDGRVGANICHFTCCMGSGSEIFCIVCDETNIVVAETAGTSQADAYAQLLDAVSKWERHDENRPVGC